MILLSLLLVAHPPAEHLATLYAGLDPYSLPKQLAFHELYPDSPQGKAAWKRAFALLNLDSSEGASFTLAPEQLKSLIDRFTNPQATVQGELSPEQIALIDHLSSGLPHKKLKGHAVWSLEELVQVDPAEFDLARGLLLTFFGERLDKRSVIASCEACLDLLALQVLARDKGAGPEAKIAQLNHLLFFELGIRFPPQSRIVRDIDLYSFLPAVLDKRRGVCLGISNLYLCLAQRLSLNLEAVTPPGHIYVRYISDAGTINIETTARGVHVQDHEYLSMQNRKLQPRTLKEVVGLTFMNQGAALWQGGKLEEAVAAYRSAYRYLPDDLQVKEFLGYTLLLTGQLDEGRSLLSSACGQCDPYMVAPSTAIADLLAQKADLGGIQAIFLQVDETRESILQKQKELRDSVTRCPEFRAGWLQLATTYLQLSRYGEALAALERYHEIDPTDPVVEYYLAALGFERHDYPLAWAHLQQAQLLARRLEYAPRPLREIERALKLVSPE